jgi:phosphate starvation-inducible protein PhoH
VVRHRLVKAILRAYTKEQEKENPPELIKKERPQQ